MDATLFEEPYHLTPEQIEAYRRDGQILLRNVAPDGAVEALRPSLQEILSQAASRRDSQGRLEDYSRLFQQVTNVWKMSETVRTFVFAKRFARLAAELMGVDGVRLYHDQALFKPAGGKATPWHQDQIYWPHTTPHTITMWMPLIDLTREMGTMCFANGSHIHGALVQEAISERSDTLLTKLIEERKIPVQSYALSAGDATFHSGWTAHAAFANNGAVVREVFTIIYYANGSTIMQPDNKFREVDMLAFHPGQQPGELASSPLNPLLYHRQE